MSNQNNVILAQVETKSYYFIKPKEANKPHTQICTFSLFLLSSMYFLMCAYNAGEGKDNISEMGLI
jgi:hypothetical protein